MYRSEYIVCFRSEISFVPLLFSHRTPFLRPYWQIYFNSTSNHNTLQNYHNAYGVVSYFNSTSNHNSPVRELSRRGVVSYFNSTSNHNSPSNRVENMRLFLISILHQTTTEQADVHISPRCFLFQFYIKPQLNGSRNITVTVVSYFNSTSNHNTTGARITIPHVVSYFNSTSNHNTPARRTGSRQVVSYFNSTSNHNQ